MSDLLDEAHEFLLCMDKMEYADALFALRAELTEARRQLAAQPAVPEAVAKDVFSGVTHIDAGFNYSTETRLTTPSVTLFFEPGNGEKNSTWLARDAFRERLHAILSATDSEVKNGNP